MSALRAEPLSLPSPGRRCKYCGDLAGDLFNGSPVCNAHALIVARTKSLYERMPAKRRKPIRRRYWHIDIIPLAPLRLVRPYMAISFLAKGTVATNSTANTTCAPGIPAGCTNLTTRMYMFISVSGNKTASLNTPAGWTALTPFTNNSTSITLAVYAKWFATGDGAPSVTWTTTAKNSGIILAYNGLDLTTPEDLSIVFGTGSSTSLTSPTATAVTMGACRLAIGARAGSAAATAYDFRMVNRNDTFTSSTSPAAITVDDEFGMASGALGTRTDTIASQAWVTATLWLRPATPATIGLVQSAKAQANGTSVTATFPATTTANNLLTAEFTCSTAATVTIPNFAAPQSATNAPTNFQTVQQLYRENAPASTTVVATRGSGSDNNSLVVKEWKGIATASSLETQGSNTAATSSAALVVTSGGTTSGQRLAIATFTEDDSTGTWTFDTGYTHRWDMPTNSLSQIASEDITFAGGSTKTAQMTFSGTANLAGQIMVFKAVSTSNSLASTINAQSGQTSNLAAGLTKKPSSSPAPISAVTGTLKTTHQVAGSVASQSAQSSALSLTKKPSATITDLSSIAAALSLTKTPRSTILSQSGQASALALTKFPRSTILAQSGDAAALSLTKLPRSTSASQSGQTSALTLAKLLAAIILSQSGQSSALSLVKKPVGSVGSLSNVSAALSLVKLLSSSPAALSSASGSLTAGVLLAALASGQSNVAGSVALSKLLRGSVAGGSASNGSLSLVKLLYALAASSSSVSGSPSITHMLRGTVVDQASVSGALSLVKLLASAILVQSVLAGDLSQFGVSNLAASIAAHSTTSADLALAKFLAASVGSLGTVTGDVSLTKLISSRSDPRSSVSGNVALTKFIASVVAGQSLLMGDLTLVGITHLTSSIAAHSTASGALSLSKLLSGSVGSGGLVSGNVSLTKLLAARSDPRSSVVGAIALTKLPRGASSGRSSVSGTLLIVGFNFLTGSAAGRSSVSAALLLRRDLAGILAAQSALTGDFTITRQLRSMLAGRSALAGSVELEKFLYGTVFGQSGVRGILNVANIINGPYMHPLGIIGDPPIASFVSGSFGAGLLIESPWGTLVVVGDPPLSAGIIGDVITELDVEGQG